ncbi:hypothetical protein CLIB1444_14S01442 [[Candida] jaroonii]|uniref:Uncharacterized protein n=1 Tax=[Candida] jaroonii TaxID=467808 RepID=A0ACA9YF83_9ASCO|nr:hypothetical protein CLIB1444_14S01442 [[Candida] jaroonii]
MSTITLSKESHKNPEKFRIKYEDADAVLGPKKVIKKDESLPVKESYSKVTIIGAGFGGITTALSIIKNLGCDFKIFEKHDDLGGTWYANTYPGCASDIPAIWYSIFDEMVTNWSDSRPPQYEMQEYMQEIVKKYKLKESCYLSTQVVEARYMEKSAEWQVESWDLKTGQKITHRSKILVNCSGGLVVPNVFKPKGMETFKGNYMHSAIWDHSVDFKGKQVIVVGNGCSAAQVVPALLDYEPKSIVQTIRSQHYIFPPHPKFLYFLYWLLGWNRIGLVMVRWLVAVVAESRYPMFAGNGIINRIMRWVNTRASLRYMKKTIPEKYHDIVIPKFKIGCKRLIFDYYYAPALRDKRIDVKLDEITEVKPHSVVLKSGIELPADIIVACTGYNITQSMNPYHIIGRDGFDLNQTWKEEGQSAYETILVKKCPNFFMVPGPNSATGHSSVVLAIENCAKYFSLVAPKILNGEIKSLEVKSEKYEEWFSTTQDLLRKSVFGTAFGGCVSWYSNDKVNPTAYPYSQITYFRRMRNVKWQDFNIER